MVKGRIPFPLHLTVQFELRIQSDNKLNTQTLILYESDSLNPITLYSSFIILRGNYYGIRIPMPFKTVH